jgi:hypothetical protein
MPYVNTQVPQYANYQPVKSPLTTAQISSINQFNKRAPGSTAAAPVDPGMYGIGAGNPTVGDAATIQAQNKTEVDNLMRKFGAAGGMGSSHSLSPDILAQMWR